MRSESLFGKYEAVDFASSLAGDGAARQGQASFLGWHCRTIRSDPAAPGLRFRRTSDPIAPGSQIWVPPWGCATTRQFRPEPSTPTVAAPTRVPPASSANEFAYPSPRRPQRLTRHAWWQSGHANWHGLKLGPSIARHLSRAGQAEAEVEQRNVVVFRELRTEAPNRSGKALSAQNWSG